VRGARGAHARRRLLEDAGRRRRRTDGVGSGLRALGGVLTVATACEGASCVRWALAESTAGSVRCGGSGCLAAPACTSVGARAAIGRPRPRQYRADGRVVACRSLLSLRCVVRGRVRSLLASSPVEGGWTSPHGLPSPWRRRERAAASTRQTTPASAEGAREAALSGDGSRRRTGAPRRRSGAVRRSRRPRPRPRTRGAAAGHCSQPTARRAQRAEAHCTARSVHGHADGSSVRRRLVRRWKRISLHRTTGGLCSLARWRDTSTATHGSTPSAPLAPCACLMHRAHEDTLTARAHTPALTIVR
jgi:hypothetical protein